ncbi:ABC transporter ATP-binding protein [Streptomyces lunaelactis]|uniref:ABC transporter ATP-binding protein n=2 Tax=Streptomyces lunaelactis TaxID=1535768 RepID=UPI001584F816|nr:ABC transporter ATP-binding protein [Streptomyces lunaelactis]NUK22634.1 ABC transporter ATP-binding protein [Streptomyces lunaelactis]NUK58140.1 ABC transporter ATP-binding protein [Streptomyces lunaelactis]NUK62878.1 ABC transporter ATP-binding protein [Streptomyces lunaelactis]NUK78097.1 ABC transporter ATP-binding protein [Streptomyces lunaelactis]NUL12254.1 ABC transporter ATP-binding protein [Streptomyces lunaelactis]
MAATHTAPAVQLDGISKSYGDSYAVHDLTLDIAPGEFFSLLGPSGCGKTTSLRMIGGFTDPTDGVILLGGEDVTGLPPNKRNVNTVFQSYALFDHLSVADNVAFGLKRKGVARAEIRERVATMLDQVQLGNLAERKPHTLSGGQRQRVALARALVNRPQVLLLDEPLAALDLKLRRQMQVELKQIQREVGITFVFVTHDQDEALTMSDRMAVMNDGHVEQCGTPEDVYERPASSFVASFMGTSNLVAGTYRAGEVVMDQGPALPVGPRTGITDGSRVSLAIRPEKIWLTDLAPGMARVSGVVRETVYSGPTTTYLIELAPGVTVSVLEQNTDRSRMEDRWSGGESVEIGWQPEHCLVLD